MTDLEREIGKFRATISTGDFVVVYYSGHGFSYGPDSFIMPRKFDKELSESRMILNFMSVSGIVGILQNNPGNEPGFVLVINDACRNYGGPKITTATSDPNRQKKGAPDRLSVLPDRMLVAYAAGTGQFSQGYNNPDKLSTFTRMLVKNITRADATWEDIWKDVVIDVKFATRSDEVTQVPAIYGSMESYLWFQPGENALRLERESFKAARLVAEELRDPTAIEKFKEKFAVGHLAEAARKWLDWWKNRPITDQKPMVLATLPPEAVDAAWTRVVSKSVSNTDQGNQSQPPQPGKYNRSIGTEVATVAGSQVSDVSGSGLGYRTIIDRTALSPVKVALPTPKLSGQPSKTPGSVYTAQRPTNGAYYTRAEYARLKAALSPEPKLVLARSVESRVDPSAKAAIARRLTPGEAVVLISSSTPAVGSRDDSEWLKVRTVATGEVVFVPTVDASSAAPSKPRAASAAVVLGRPWLEVIAPPVDGTIKTLIDAKDVEAALREIKAAGETVSQISIVSAATINLREASDRYMRITHAKSILLGAGVPGEVIAAVNGADDHKGDSLQIRFFVR